MRNIKKLSVVIIMVLIVSMVVPSIASAAKLNKTKVELNVGDTVKLKLTGVKGKITWTSSDKSIATVTKKGKVTAKTEGKAIITGKAKYDTFSCDVTVNSTTKADTVTFTLPTETYTNDMFFPEFFKDIQISTEVKGNNTIIICKTKYVDLLKKELAASYEEAIAGLVTNGAVDKIVINKKYTEMQVFNSNKNMNSDDAMSLFFLYCLVPYYQFFNGVSYDKLDLYIRSYDNNGKLIEEGSFKQLIGQ